uniref:Putative vasa intronic protein n=1 Tax=Ixodes ricinus TaxID=34613 RepID=A0A0K8R6J9_IXORI
MGQPYEGSPNKASLANDSEKSPIMNVRERQQLKETLWFSLPFCVSRQNERWQMQTSLPLIPQNKPNKKNISWATFFFFGGSRRSKAK